MGIGVEGLWHLPFQTQVKLWVWNWLPSWLPRGTTNSPEGRSIWVQLCLVVDRIGDLPADEVLALHPCNVSWGSSGDTLRDGAPVFS